MNSVSNQYTPSIQPKPDYSQDSDNFVVDTLLSVASLLGEGYINIARRQKQGHWFYSPESNHQSAL